ncbi:MAG: hypothetical protein ZNDK_0737 [Candidatus Desulfovibrio kirbyi]|jgi:uncharacterized protein (DUF4415 family)|uniref:BrnA antitoxin of type II toxin-antitoxin system n=1 Tax=Candidatus Desulfovibrio kirbyi TaxID=2696086 RepID=A0A6L2R5X7_9BACT|nr:MAG: hypothetical protein ZNDK_0737 [Candidatus Desulfovibrio kirbyi]
MNKNRLPTAEEQMVTLKQKADKDIDFSDIPEITDWSDMVRGKFYRPIKRQVSLRIDADILDWFKNHNPQYQTAINTALRQYVHAQQ